MYNRQYLAIGVAKSLLVEMQVPKDPSLRQLVKEPPVQRLITLSKKGIKENLSPQEKKEIKSLLKDDKVERYLEASKKVGQRIGWIKGGLLGAASGTVHGTVAAIGLGASGVGIFALVLLGAIAGGLSIGWLSSKIHGILRKWKAEEEITKGGLQSGTIFNM
jgi:hypothetical protein